MSHYREVRVRPVVRYVVTLFEQESDGNNVGQFSVPYGVFDNVVQANIVGEAIADRERVRNTVFSPNDATEAPAVIFEPARKLRIDWLHGRLVLSEPD